MHTNKIKEPALLSIIIPIYNVENYLEDCLNSVIKQDFPSMEIICVDDCSTDESLKILKNFTIKDKRIKVIELDENTGQGNARNIGLKHACGKYICYLDSDDMLAERCLKHLLPYLNEDLDMLTYEIAEIKFDVRPKNFSDDLYRLKYDYSKLGVKPGRKFFAEMISNREFYYNVVFALYNRLWLINNGITFKKGIIYEDGPYILACYLLCEKMRHVNVGVYVRRYRANSTMMSANKLTFAHTRGLLWGYEEATRLYYQISTLNQQERECLLQLILNNMEEAKKNIIQLSPKEILQFQNLEGISKLLLTETNASVNYSELCLDGLRLRIMEAEKVYLYGAGKIGLLTLSYLRSVNLSEKVIGFIETNKNAHKKHADVPVFCIREVIPNEKTLLVISASTQYHTNMSQNAKQQGFKNIIFIDSILTVIMQKKL